jgi:choice-of-anchor B domain-containing protein
MSKRLSSHFWFIPTLLLVVVLFAAVLNISRNLLGASEASAAEAAAPGDAQAHDHGADHEKDGNPLPDHHQALLNDKEPNVAWAALSATPCVNGYAAQFPCDNVDLLAYLPLSNIGGGNGNDIWGWTDPVTGKEYAIMGRSSGTAFVDISDPENPVYVGNLPTHTTNSSWRDIKVYNDHAFVVSEASNHGVQVFDLNQLRTVILPPVTFANSAHYNGIGSAHNIAINEQSGYAYAVGASSCSGGLHMINIQNSLSPTFAGCYSLDGYIHDTQCVIYSGPDVEHHGKEICFNSNGSNITNAFTVVDVTNKGTPIRLSQSGYAGSRYSHQGWLTEDQRYFLLDDELDEQQYGHSTRTYVWDVSNLDAPILLGYYNGTTAAIDHNQYIVDNHSYQANYRSGLRILNIDNIATNSLVEVAYFDIYPANDNPNFNGAWSVYPFFESGVVVVSGIEQGLFVLQPRLLPAWSITKSQPDGVIAVSELVTYTISVTNSGPMTATGVVVTDTLNGVATQVPGPTTILPGASADYLFTYTIEPDDCQTGLSNDASASSNEGEWASLAEPVTTFVACHGLLLSTGQPLGDASAGQTLTYTVNVTNTGNVTATAVTVSGELNGVSQAMTGATSIASGQTATYYLTYSPTGADCDPGLTFQATVSSGEGVTVSSDPPITTAVSCPPPALLITMGTPAGQATPGASITYTIRVTNTSEWLANGVVVTSTVNGATVNVTGPATIAANGVAQYQLVYAVTDSSCSGLSALAAVSSANGSWASLAEPVLTPVTCVYRLFIPIIARP